jgi:hypothetical protein
MSNRTNRIFQVGDRVAERPKTHGMVAVRAEAKEQVAKYRSQRYGTVIDFTSKKIKSGGYQKFLVIQWDHLQTPCEHARGRICHLDEFPKLMRETTVAY